MEEDPDLEIVRPDRNHACTSTSASFFSSSLPPPPPPPPPSPPPSHIDKIDPSSLSDFELEEKINDYRRIMRDLHMNDGNAKLRRRLLCLQNELARRRPQTQTGTQVEVIEDILLPRNSSLPKRKQKLVDLEIRSSSPDQQPSRPLLDKGHPIIALECDRDNGTPSSAHTKKNDLNDIQDLEESPRGENVNICFLCHQTVTNGIAQHNDKDQRFCCLRCKKSPTSSFANIANPVNSMGENSCGFPRLEKSPGSTKCSQQAVGNTFDTALELSDDEELREVIVGESSSGNNLSKRKRLRSASKTLAGPKFLYPSSCDPEAVEVQYADLGHLAPSEFLNDTVIDFYIKYMKLNLLEEKDRLNRFHFFSCFFYKKLTAIKKAKSKEWFEKLHKWTKGINIFKKSYLFIPIHDSCHWSLGIICFRMGQKVPYILHLDSMSSTAGHPSPVIFNVLKSYLAAERRHLMQQNGASEDIATIEPSKANCKRVPVPLQDNEWDCGLFMLYYIQKFVQEVDSIGLDDMFGRNWFKANEASELRGTIFTILESIFIQQAKTTTPVELDNHASGSSGNVKCHIATPSFLE